MTRRLLSIGVFVLAVSGITSEAYARRGIPIPVIGGYGEELTEMGDLPPEVSRAVTRELGSAVRVAYLHQRVHVFWLDVWTWNGRHVLHSGDTYWEPDSTQWQEMIGADPVSKYGKPILYRLPLIPALLIVAFVGSAVHNYFFKTDEEILKALMIDKRYQRSIETIFGRRDEQEFAKAITTVDEQRFLRAKNELIGDGLDPHTAESNLRKVTDAILANTNAQIDAYLEVASRLDHEGEWDKSAEVYAQLISSLPDNDDRLTYVRNCLAAVKDKRSVQVENQLIER